MQALERMEHSLPEQGKACSAIPLSFDKLQFINLTFDLTVGIDQC